MTTEERREYEAIFSQRVEELKQTARELFKKEKELASTVKEEIEVPPQWYLSLADTTVNGISYLLVVNQFFHIYRKERDKTILIEARKACHRAVIYLEKVFSRHLSPDDEQKTEFVARVSGFPEKELYALTRKVGFTIVRLKEALKDFPQWRWALVDLQGRLVVLAKNCVNPKEFFSGLDPLLPLYQLRMRHFLFIKKLLEETAQELRSLYATSRKLDDFHRAISFLEALRRMMLQMNRLDAADELKRRMEVWRRQFEKEQRSRRANPPGGSS